MIPSKQFIKIFIDQGQDFIFEGPTPKPDIIRLRNWDYRLLERYNPVYTPNSEVCGYCTYGKCDLTGNKEGACGIDLETQSAREALITCIMGAASHTGHAIHLLNYCIKIFGKDYSLDVGPSEIKASD